MQIMRHSTANGLVVLMMVLLVGAGCSSRPARVLPPDVDPTAAAEIAIELYDVNNDGGLDAKELDKCPGLKSAASIYSAANPVVTADAIRTRIEAWHDSKMGRARIRCSVRRKGIPLEGATVEFVPEEFLGEEIQPASGTTDSDGMSMPTVSVVDAGELRGIAPGFYRVKITKPGLDIPKEYNTETVLGQEVAMDASSMLGVRFDLNF